MKRGLDLHSRHQYWSSINKIVFSNNNIQFDWAFCIFTSKFVFHGVNILYFEVVQFYCALYTIIHLTRTFHTLNSVCFDSFDEKQSSEVTQYQS